jgi:hypothetical protein
MKVFRGVFLGIVIPLLFFHYPLSNSLSCPPLCSRAFSIGFSARVFAPIAGRRFVAVFARLRRKAVHRQPIIQLWDALYHPSDGFRRPLE